jgi:translation initiation factor IF-3
LTIRRPFQPPRKDDGTRINDEITALKIRLIDENGEMLGVFGVKQAIEKAIAAGLDLVEISPNAEPPVCKILDYGKFKYENQKKLTEAKKKQKTVEVKEIKLRPAIGDHDYEVKLKAAKKFIENGDKLKVTLRFRGREMAHMHLGFEVLNRLKSDMAGLAKVDQEPKPEGKQVMIMMSPDTAATIKPPTVVKSQPAAADVNAE